MSILDDGRVVCIYVLATLLRDAVGPGLFGERRCMTAGGEMNERQKTVVVVVGYELLRLSSKQCEGIFSGECAVVVRKCRANTSTG